MTQTPGTLHAALPARKGEYSLGFGTVFAPHDSLLYQILVPYPLNSLQTKRADHNSLLCSTRVH